MPEFANGTPIAQRERRLRLHPAAADLDFAAPALHQIAARVRRIREIPVNADVAQLVEHFTRNEGVPGSSPGVGSGEGPVIRLFHGQAGIWMTACPKYVPSGVTFWHGCASLRPPSGHVFRVERARGPVWYAKYRLPDGRQVQRKVGPAWTERGRPPAGYFTKRQAEDWLREVLDGARRGTLPGLVRTGVTFGEAAAEWLRYIEHDRRRKPSTVVGYKTIVRAQLLPAFGDLPLESITTQLVETWIGSMERTASTRTKALVLLHGIFQRARKVWGLTVNPVRDVEKPPIERSGDIEVFSPEEVYGLVRAAANEQDAALYLTAAFTGLRRGELLALRWRDVDFTGSVIRVRASYAEGQCRRRSPGRCARCRWHPMWRQRSRGSGTGTSS